MNDKIFKKGYNKLNENQMLVEEFDDTHIKGRFTAEEDCILYTSIPYDHGWTVKIDGKKVSDLDVLKLGQALLAVKVKEGNHTIELSYSVGGFKLGAAITLFTLFALGFYFLLRRQIRAISAKILPSFNPVDTSLDEYIYISEIKKPIAEIKPIVVKPITERISCYIPPKKEIISPVDYKPVVKEIILPSEDKTE